MIRPIPALLALAAGVALSVAVAAASSTQVGETTTAPVGDLGSPIVPVSTVAGTASYETPDGVLTKWRFHSSNDGTPGKIKLKIFRATGSPSQYEIIGDSSLKDLDADKSYEFDERIPVQKGDLLGLLGQSMADIVITTPGQPGNVVGAFNGNDIAPGNSDTVTSPLIAKRVSLAATVESDADKDGYGDDTQDECTTDPKIHSSKCPKTTTTTPKDNRRPKVTLGAAGKQNLIGQRGVFVTVGSDENGTVKATGSVSIEKVHFSRSYSMSGTSAAIAVGAKKTLKVGASKKLRRKVKRALRRHRKVRAQLRITVQDAAGNKTSKTTTIKIKRPRR